MYRNGSSGVKITFSESYLKTLKPGSNFFSASFENCDIKHIAIVNVEQAENAEGTAAEPKVGAPKTGDNGAGVIAALLTVSGAAAYISRKKK